MPEPLADVPMQMVLALLGVGQSEHRFDERPDGNVGRRRDLGAREGVLSPRVVQCAAGPNRARMIVSISTQARAPASSGVRLTATCELHSHLPAPAAPSWNLVAGSPGRSGGCWFERTPPTARESDRPGRVPGAVLGAHRVSSPGPALESGRGYLHEVSGARISRFTVRS